MDVFTRWIEIIPLKSISAEEVVENIYVEWICRYPKPERVISDNGTQFISKGFL